jgi:hypothetical protein
MEELRWKIPRIHQQKGEKKLTSTLVAAQIENKFREIITHILKAMIEATNSSQ